MIDLKEVKTLVAGIQGSGKTFFVSNHLIKTFKNPVIYGIHISDYTKCRGSILQPENLSTKELDKNSILIKKLAIEGKCDCFILDEADMFIGGNLDVLKAYNNLYDLIINHRHYKKGYPKDDRNIKGLALIFITRRPQSISTEIVETCENIFVFAIGGDNVKRKFRAIHEDFDKLLPELKKKYHNFIHYELGEKPEIYSRISVEN